MICQASPNPSVHLTTAFLSVGPGPASMHRWSAVLALRGQGEKQASDTRILGNSEFVQEVTSDLDDLVKKNLRLSGRQIDIVTLAGGVCKKHGISLGELCSEKGDVGSKAF